MVRELKETAHVGGFYGYDFAARGIFVEKIVKQLGVIEILRDGDAQRLFTFRLLAEAKPGAGKYEHGKSEDHGEQNSVSEIAHAGDKSCAHRKKQHADLFCGSRYGAEADKTESTCDGNTGTDISVDQTRGWFHSLMAESTLLFNKAPYENVIVLGHVQDENGQKMSKSKGNAVDPFDALKTYGADAIRWYFYTASAPWIPKRFSGKLVQEGQRKFMGTLWNTYAFFVLYANIDNFDATKYTLEYDKLPVMDKWLLSKLNSAVAAVDDNLSNYRIPEAARALDDFVDEMSNWYVRRSRERFWAKGMEQDKINAYMTLYTALVTISKAAAPMIPFMTEDIYRNLVCSIDPTAPESVHLCDFPVVDEKMIDKKLEEDMEVVLEAVVLGRSCRNEANIKNRQPIAKIFVKAEDELSQFYLDIIRDELNVKEIEATDDVSALINYTFKPQLKTLGRRFGKNINAVKEILAGLNGQQAMKELNETGALTITVDGNEEKLTQEDLLIEAVQMEGYVSASDHGVTVVLDTNMTEELLEEGFVRELVSKIQTMRKEAGFEVMDHIAIGFETDEKVTGIFAKYGDAIKKEVLGEKITAGSTSGYTKAWNINGEEVTLSVEKQ